MAVPVLPRRLQAAVDAVVVCTHGDPRALPEAPLPGGYTLRELDMEDPEDISRWLTVHNAAFGREWGFDDFRRTMYEHPHYAILRTFLVEHGDRPVGTTSSGYFRRNPEIGVGHYGAVVPSERRLGIGRSLSVHRYRACLERGLTRCEAETTMGRTPSLLVQFGLGMRPKLEPDEWNTTDSASRLARRIARVRLQRLHQQWRAAQNGAAPS